MIRMVQTTCTKWLLIRWIYKKWCDGDDRCDVNGNRINVCPLVKQAIHMLHYHHHHHHNCQ